MSDSSIPAPFRQKQRLASNQRLFWLGGGLVALALGLGLYLYLVSRGGIVIVNPRGDFTVTLNDQPISPHIDRRGLYIPTYPGIYRLKITSQNYLPFTEDVRVERGQTIEVQPVFTLVPNKGNQASQTVQFVRPSLDQSSVFYLGNSNRTLYHLDVAKQIEVPLTNAPLFGVEDVQWSSQPDVALVTQSDGTYLQEIPLYDFRNQVLLKIAGPEMASPIWDPTNPERIAFTYNPPSGEHTLVFSDKRLTKLDRRADLSSLINPRLIWSPDSSSILLLNRSSNYSKDNLWIYSLADGSLKPLTSTGNITNASFSTGSDRILLESYDRSPENPVGNSLSIINLDGSSASSLQVDGRVSDAAWKDDQSFFLPAPESNQLYLYKLDGSLQKLPFSFPEGSNLESLNYLSASQTIVFSTADAIYLSRVGN